MGRGPTNLKLVENLKLVPLPGEHGQPAMQANFKNGLAVVAQHLEGLLLRQATLLGNTVHGILKYIGKCRQRQRPGRSYPRRSLKPGSKWRSSNRKKGKDADCRTKTRPRTPKSPRAS